MPTLFEPVDIGTLTLSNRLVMAPMTRSRTTEDGQVTASTAQYYAQRATAGLIVTEGVQPSPVGQGYPNTPGLHEADQIAAWHQVTDAVHATGGRVFAQLMHAGRIGHPSLLPDGLRPVAPSPVRAAGQVFTSAGPLDNVVPTELTTEQVAETVQDFATAARNAIAAGFDGVELHGANGYLIQQFLADSTNLRTDRYGGSVRGRIRFAVETVRAVADAIGADRVGLRVSPAGTFNDITESDSAELYTALVRELAPLRIAYLHVMEAGTREITRALRPLWPTALILNPHPEPGTPVGPEQAREALASGLADAVSFGTLFLANPDLVDRIRAGGPYNEPDQATFYGGDARGYTDYPTLAQAALSRSA